MWNGKPGKWNKPKGKEMRARSDANALVVNDDYPKPTIAAIGPVRRYPPAILAALPPPLHTAIAATIAPPTTAPTDSADRRLVPRLPTPTQLAYTVSPLLSAAECRALVAATERLGYAPALLNVGGGAQLLAPEVRSSLRRIVDSPRLAAELWSRLTAAGALPFTDAAGRRAVRLNERLRFLKYKPGDRFAPHRDGRYRREDGSEESVLTLQVYLGEEGGCEGGRTTMWFEEDEKGEYGMMEVDGGRSVVFDHRVFHEGAEVTAGVKYTIRTDVMFECLPAPTGAPVAVPDN
ncbi:hypothetical protein DFJ73DRAFT_578856 [Zopfochytrium polystomum]|nr:hypothetical protein DFJ73DRAFT_578856 [Zopfochytrium polystomum]